MKQEGDVPLKEMAEKLMQDTTRVDQDQLPNTGCGLEKESLLSSIFIDIDNDQVST